MDVLRHTDPPRVPRPIADHFVPGLPWIGTFFARGGMVGGSRGNARALLEAGELLLIFPEGTPGIVKPFPERYQLRPFRVGHAELAIRFGAPIVPIGVVGAEEQLPSFLSSRRLGRPFGVPEVPIPVFPFPLPVRYRILYGDPIPVHLEHKPEDADDPEVVAAVAERVQAAVHALLQRGLKARKGVFG
jgi:1-acyl-sn-glycerol-3-phosphate acyltransferase